MSYSLSALLSIFKNNLFEYLLKAKAEFKHDFTVPTLLINGDQ